MAWISVHAGHGYNVCDNSYKLALMYLLMFLPLLLNGAGKLSPLAGTPADASLSQFHSTV